MRYCLKKEAKSKKSARKGGIAVNAWRRRSRRYRNRMPGRLPPAAIVGICLGAAVLIAVIIGNLLHFWLDDETMQKLTSGTSAPEETLPVPDREVPLVKAYPFTLGDSTGSLSPDADGMMPAALSVSLNLPTGELLYTSEVSEYFGMPGDENVELTDSMTDLREAVPYLCGVFYPQSFTQEDGSLFYPSAAKEAALLREFARSGGSEVLLVGLSFDSGHLMDTLTYLGLIKEALGSTTLGVSVPLSLAASEQGWELLPILRENADLLVLDLQGEDPSSAEDILLIANYYLVQHEMRLLLSSDQETYIAIAEATLSDVQIVTAPPVSDSGDSGEGEGTDTEEPNGNGTVG